MVHASPASAKTVMRLEARALRRSLAKSCARAAELATERFPSDGQNAGRVVGGYSPRGAEISPWPLLLRLKSAGARIALPATVAADRPLVFRAWGPEQDQAPDALGIPSPPPTAEEVRPDLLIVPLLAFDRQGGRLGQGGGYFDRTLQALAASGPVFALGLAYAGQEVARVPAEEHDRPLDAILTEREYIAVARAAE